MVGGGDGGYNYYVELPYDEWVKVLYQHAWTIWPGVLNGRVKRKKTNMIWTRVGEREEEDCWETEESNGSNSRDNGRCGMFRGLCIVFMSDAHNLFRGSACGGDGVSTALPIYDRFEFMAVQESFMASFIVEHLKRTNRDWMEFPSHWSRYSGRIAPAKNAFSNNRPVK